jgi:uncharacterized membrane protein YfcA
VTETIQTGGTVTHAPLDPARPAPADVPATRFRDLARGSLSNRRTFIAGIVVPVVAVVALIITLLLAPAGENRNILFSFLIAVAAGLAATSIGVYGGVLVPGLLLLGVDPRFAAAASLFLQVLVIPVAAGSHYRVGHFNRKLAIPLIIGGMTGAFIGPFVAAQLSKETIARFVALMIIGVGLLVFATLRRGTLGAVRAPDDVPQGRVAGIGTVAGFASGVSGAGWGPVGGTLLLLSRIDPKQAVGSSLFARVFMAISAVVGYVISAAAFKNIDANWWIVVPLLAGSIAPMVPGTMIIARLGRERATILITLLSICLAVPTLIWGH